MNRREFVKSGFWAGAAGSAAAMSTPAAGNSAAFRAGFAERDITPEIGMEVPGGYGKAFATKIHDPCKVRAAVFEDGANRVALVGIDAGTVPRNVVLEVRSAVRERCGLSPESVLIGASHSHSSGPIGEIQPDEYDHASKFVQHLAYEKSTTDNPKYVAMARRQMIEAICAAAASSAESRCGVGSGSEGTVAFNRRFRMKNGLSYTHPGQGNPDIVEPAGPIDPEVGVLGSWDRNGRLVGCVVNYACHATTSPEGFSANWIYYMEKVIRGAFGDDVVVVFLQGASGDVTQVDNLSPYKPGSGEEQAWLVGGRVGAEAVKALLGMTPGELAPVRSASETLRIPRRAPAPERVKEAYRLAKLTPEEAGSTRWTFAKEIVLLDAKLRKEPVADVEVQAIQVGPAVFVSNPAELFCEYGLEIKKKCAFPFTFPVELANGQVGYVPTEEAFGPNGGGYETRLTSYSNLEIKAGRKMVDKGVELAARMTPGTVPEPERAQPYSDRPGGIGPTEWSYGNVGPEIS